LGSLVRLLRILVQGAVPVARKAVQEVREEDQEVAVVVALRLAAEDGVAVVEDSVEAEDVEAVAVAADLLRAGVTL
jgi:hypothetical protein